MKKIIFIIFSAMVLLGCKKQDEWLDKKSNQADVVPKTLADMQAMLDNDGVMNANYPQLGNVSSDNYFVSYANWQAALTKQEHNAYIWATNIYEGETGFDWRYAYQMVEYANIVLEQLSKIDQTSANSASWNNVKGSALFFRALAFYNLAQLFAKPYSSNAANDMGIPIRTSSDVNQLSGRAPLSETYNRIISDLNDAVLLLPAIPAIKTRPSKTAAQGLLARIYMNTGEYEKASTSASAALALYNTLIDFNSLSTSAPFPFPTIQNNNPEVIFYATNESYFIMGVSRLLVDTTLFSQYDFNDLRKTVLYKLNAPANISFKGTYTGNSSFFGGIATNELYLIRAEAQARLGNTVPALADLNALLSKRWKNTFFISVTATSPGDALAKILVERRKELPYTANLRWEDLRRLNSDPRFAITLTRIVNSQTYTLAPGDPKYVLPIPDDEIKLSGISQNPR